MKYIRVGFFISFLMIVSYVLCESSYHFAVLSDRTGGADQEAFEMVVKDIVKLYPDLVVTVGDIIEDGIYEDWEVVLKPIQDLKCPIYYTPGNNDILDEETEKNFRETTGHNPYYSFNFDNSHFIILDNSRYSNYNEMGLQQLTWLEKDLEINKSKTNIFVFMHKPFWTQAISGNEPDSLHSIFVNYNVKAVFTGHWHHYAHEVIDGIEYYICGSSGGRFGDIRDDDLAEFYQFLWCYVEDDQLNVSLMKSGFTFDKNIKNLEEANFCYQIPENYIEVNCDIIDPVLNKQKLEISITNHTEKVISEQIEIISENWDISENSIEVKIDLEDTFETQLYMTAISSELPYPTIKFNYPFGRDKIYPYEKLIMIERLLYSKGIDNIPLIDGYITEEWNNSQTDKILTEINGEIDDLTTSSFIMNDNIRLYLGTICYNNDPEMLYAKGSNQQLEIFSDDYIGFIISSDMVNYTQFYINPKGNYWFMQSDLSNNTSDQEIPDNIKFAAQINSDSWSVELGIPLDVLKLKEGNEIHINIRRHSVDLANDYFLIPEWSYKSIRNAKILLD